MRKSILATNHFYHIYNRGVDKRDIFLNDGYYSRFLSLLEHYLQFDYPYSLLMQRLERARSPEEKQLVMAGLETKRIESPLEIISICLMPNHFHLTIKQLKDKGISSFMHRIGIGFTQYLNLRQERSGRLFEGPFKARIIETDEQLIHLSRYQHINPKTIDKVYSDTRNIIKYPWSSLSTYLETEPSKRRFKFVNPAHVLAHFNRPEEYLEFVMAEVDEFEPVRLNEVAVDDDFGWFSKHRTLKKERRQNLINHYLSLSS